MGGGEKKKVFFNLTESWKYIDDKRECVISYCTFKGSEIEKKKKIQAFDRNMKVAWRKYEVLWNVKKAKITPHSIQAILPA